MTVCCEPPPELGTRTGAPPARGAGFVRETLVPMLVGVLIAAGLILLYLGAGWRFQWPMYGP